ncbi:MAG: hypothetical protein ACI82Q_000591 [Nonlabens sp.]|jgi:hypothetical protein
MSVKNFTTNVFQLNNNGAESELIPVTNAPNPLANNGLQSEDYLSLGTGTTLVADGSASMTLSAWVMLTAFDVNSAGVYNIMTCGGNHPLNPTEMSNVTLYIAFDANRRDQELRFNLSGWEAATPIEFVPFRWYHVAVTYEGGQSTTSQNTNATFYVDGVASGASLNKAPDNSALQLPQTQNGWQNGVGVHFTKPTTLIGSFNIFSKGSTPIADVFNLIKGRWPGYIGPFRIWNHQLDVSEIEENRWKATKEILQKGLLFSDESPTLTLIETTEKLLDQSITDEQSLYVPVALEGLLVNDFVKSSTTFNRSSINYQDVIDFKNKNRAFDTSNNVAPENGVYLHWALPDALTHGMQKENGSIEFPLVPNRWLVVRYSPSIGKNTQGRAMFDSSTWVIESDYLNPTDGSNSYLDPVSTTPTETKIGKSSPLTGWSETGTQELFLKATGPDGITFATWQPGVNNVFSFFDDTVTSLTNPAGKDYVPVSYMVAGWYSDDSVDPLKSNKWDTRNEWHQLIEKLKWGVEFPDSILSLPRDCVFHGMINDVQWQNTKVPTSTFAPEASKNSADGQLIEGFNVAIGNTSAEALAALLKKEVINTSGTTDPDITSLNEFLEAFQYNFLKDLDSLEGISELNRKLHQETFFKVKSGVLFEATEAGILTDTANQSMTKFDETHRQLKAMQWENYALSWMVKYLDANPVISGLTAADITSFKAVLTTMGIPFASQVGTTLADATRWLTATGVTQTKQNELYQLPSMKTYSDNSMWKPVEPVVLLTGAGRANKHGDDGRYNENGTLLCRISSELLHLPNTVRVMPGSGIGGPMPSFNSAAGIGNHGGGSGYMGGPPPDFGTVNIVASPFNIQPPEIDTGSLPPTISPLITEASFFIAANNPNALLLTGAIADHKKFVEIVISNNIAGEIPSPLAVIPWTQAWSPLFLDWEIKWMQTPLSNMDKWEYDGEHDFNFTGTFSDLTAANTFIGRTFVTPQAINVFGESLKQHIANHTTGETSGQEHGIPSKDSDAALKTKINTITNWLKDLSGQDIMAQSLGGLNEYLINKEHRLALWPQDAGTQSVDLVYGNKSGAVPIFNIPDGNTAPWFHPVKAGFFYISKMDIVDCFGQTLDLSDTNNSGTANFFNPVIGRGLTSAIKATGGPDYTIKQSPKLVQASKINFELISHSDPTQSTKLNQSANPICGFVLPNHLDSSLMVYNELGLPLGELSYAITAGAGTTTAATAKWTAVPGSSTPYATPSAIPDANLKAIVEQITSSTDSGNELLNFLTLIDSTLWTVDPLGGRSDQHLSVLVGRPLALVRAKLQFQLDGPQTLQQTWSSWKAGTTYAEWPGLNTTTPSIASYSFPVKLGSLKRKDDGLLGFWDNDFTQFNSVHPLKSTSSYMKLIEKDNYISLPLDNSKPEYITMLIDPRGKVHASSGILPIEPLVVPEHLIKDALNAMELTFRVGPLLTDPNSIRMPEPNVNSGQWSWIQKSDPNDTTNTGIWKEEEVNKTLGEGKIDQKSAIIKEGWLKLESLNSGT